MIASAHKTERGKPHSNHAVLPLCFTGKERDEETGYGYFGARYMDHELMTMWFSVDPLADSFPHISPYSYCFNNPVRLKDPDGNIPIETIWDIANLAYDVGAAVVNHAQGNHAKAASHWADAAMDVVAVAIPYVPAGASKAVKVANSTNKAVATTKKTVRWTKNNYRRGLQQLTGKTGSGFEAHHTLPQKFEEFFSRAGINIHDPEHLLWREPHKHHTKGTEQLKEWSDFIKKHPDATKEEIMKERDRIEKKVFGNTQGDLK